MNEMLVTQRTYDVVTQMLPWGMAVALGMVVLLVLMVKQSLELSAVKKLVKQLVSEWKEACISEEESQEWVSEQVTYNAQSPVGFVPALEPQPAASSAPAFSTSSTVDSRGTAAPFIPAPSPIAPQVTAPETMESFSAPTVSAPVPPSPFPKPPASPGYSRPWAGRSEEGSLESWIGRNALGVVASILVFLGLVFLGITVAPQLSDQMKVALLFVLSGLLTAGGTALSLYKKNGFTSAVMGCGVGSLFISVFITHLYFNMIGDVAAYVLVLAWMGLCLALIRKTDSLLLAIVLQLGLAISVCLGYYGSLDASRIALLLGYQVAASVIVVGGNLLVYRRMYRASLVLGLALSIVASGFMWQYFGLFDLHEWATSNSLALVVAAFTVQLVSAAALTGLLMTSALGFGERKESVGLLTAAAGLWFIALAFDLFKVIDCCVRETMGASLHQASMIASAVSLVVVAASILGFLAIGKKRDLISQGTSQSGWAGSSAIMILVCGGALFAAVPATVASVSFGSNVLPLPWMWLWAACAVAFARVADERKLKVAALVFVCIDALYLGMFGFGFFPLRLGDAFALVLGAVYVVGLAGFAFVLLRSLGARSTGIVVFAVACTAFVMAYLTKCTHLVDEGYLWSIFCMACALACVVIGFRSGIGGLRLYGLVLTLLCVAKLVLLDISGLDSLARVGAFIIGGIICFAISALYNFAVRRLQSDEPDREETIDYR